MVDPPSPYIIHSFYFILFPPQHMSKGTWRIRYYYIYNLQLPLALINKLLRILLSLSTKPSSLFSTGGGLALLSKRRRPGNLPETTGDLLYSRGPDRAAAPDRWRRPPLTTRAWRPRPRPPSSVKGDYGGSAITVYNPRLLLASINLLQSTTPLFLNKVDLGACRSRPGLASHFLFLVWSRPVEAGPGRWERPPAPLAPPRLRAQG